MAGLNRCLFWFNPCSWWLERHLSALAEQASDEASLSLIEDAPRYAEVLLGFAAKVQDGHRFIGGVAMARRNMRARIDRILALRHPQSGILKRAGWIAIIIAAMPVLYVVAAVQSPPPRAAPNIPAPVLPAPAPVQEPAVAQPPQQTEPAARTPEPRAPLTPAEQQRFEHGLLNLEEALKRSAQVRDPQSPNFSPHYGDLLNNVETNRAYRGYLDSWNRSFQGGLPPNITLPPNSFAFFLSGGSDGTVSFRRAEGTAWNALSYGCQTCSFFVNEAGVGPENLGGAGILLKVEEPPSPSPQTPLTDQNLLERPQAGGLTLTCRARECWATQVSSWGLQPSARFKFDIAKFVAPGPYLSQVLIIVSR